VTGAMDSPLVAAVWLQRIAFTLCTGTRRATSGGEPCTGGREPRLPAVIFAAHDDLRPAARGATRLLVGEVEGHSL
jgi:hypothetical protein